MENKKDGIYIPNHWGDPGWQKEPKQIPWIGDPISMPDLPYAPKDKIWPFPHIIEPKKPGLTWEEVDKIVKKMIEDAKTEDQKPKKKAKKPRKKRKKTPKPEPPPKHNDTIEEREV